MTKREAKRPDEVERDSEPHAEPPDGARVVRNLRPQQNYGEVILHLPPLYQIGPIAESVPNGATVP